MKKIEVIGLTGNTGVGKSLFREFLSQYPDICVIDSDQVSKDILFDINNRTKLVEIFGDNTSKEQIAKVIFTDPKKKKELEDFIHPKVWEKIDEIKKETDKKIIIVESAIIYETHEEDRFSKMILLYCDNHHKQVLRIKKAHHLSISQIQSRLSTQWPDEFKIRRADIIVNSNCTKPQLKEKADIAYNYIIGRNKKKLVL